VTLEKKQLFVGRGGVFKLLEPPGYTNGSADVYYIISRITAADTCIIHIIQLL